MFKKIVNKHDIGLVSLSMSSLSVIVISKTQKYRLHCRIAWNNSFAPSLVMRVYIITANFNISVCKIYKNIM